MVMFIQILMIIFFIFHQNYGMSLDWAQFKNCLEKNSSEDWKEFRKCIFLEYPDTPIDQCDSLRKLSDIVGAQSEIIPGWTNDNLDGGPWSLPKWNVVWEKCGKDQAWYGFKEGSGVASISTTLTVSGGAELSFGNCWNAGTVKVYLDGTEIASAGPELHKTVAFDFNTGAVLSIHDEGANSVIQISQFKILTCDGNGTDGAGQISSSNNGDSVGTGLSTCCHTLRVSCDSCSEFDQPFRQFYGSYEANYEKFNNHVYYTKGQYGIWYQSGCDNCEWQIGYITDKEKMYSEKQIRINNAKNIICAGKISTYKGPKYYYEGSTPSTRIVGLKQKGLKIECSSTDT